MSYTPPVKNLIYDQGRVLRLMLGRWDQRNWGELCVLVCRGDFYKEVGTESKHAAAGADLQQDSRLGHPTRARVRAARAVATRELA